MKKQPILSINIPTYNRVSYLKEALEALLPQISDEVEINVSDNNSTDNTWDYLGTLEGRVNRSKPPAGTNANYNILSCLSLGTGEYTWIHCDDDIARLNAAENILRAINEFNRPPVLSFDWDGFDANMTGFVNRRVVAKWKRCDRNDFLRCISYKFTFASAIVIKRGCADLEYITTHAPINLIPANIIFSTVGKHNDAVISDVPLLAARGNPGSADMLTIFSKEIFRLYRSNEELGYNPTVLDQVYSDSLKTVMVHAALHFPVKWKGVWNVTSCSFGYKNFYIYVLPVLARRLTPKPLLGIVTWLWHGLKRCWRWPLHRSRKLTHWLIWRLVRKALTVTATYSGEGYAALCEAMDGSANLNFRAKIPDLGQSASVKHPIYLKNPNYFRIGSDFRAAPGLRIEAWDAFDEEQFHPLITIGNNVILNWNVHIGAINRIEIHDNVLIGSNVLITDHTHGGSAPADLAIPPVLRTLTSKGPVVIEENVLIGEGVCILAGVRIGKGAIIGANAVVCSDVDPGSVVGGVPARSINP